MKTRHIILQSLRMPALAKKAIFPRKFQHLTSSQELLKYFPENRIGTLVKCKMNPLKMLRFTYHSIFHRAEFIYKPEDTQLTCDAGTFIQNEDNTIEAECIKKGPLGIFTLYRFIFEGSGNASIKDPLILSAEVFPFLTRNARYMSLR